MSRLPLNHEHPHFLGSFSASLRDGVDELMEWLIRTFQAMERGKTGAPQRQLVLNLFAHWCKESGIVPPTTAEEKLRESVSERPDIQQLTVVLSQQLGLCDRAKARDFANQLLAALLNNDAHFSRPFVATLRTFPRPVRNPNSACCGGAIDALSRR